MLPGDRRALVGIKIAVGTLLTPAAASMAASLTFCVRVKRRPQISPLRSPDFLLNLVALVNFMRLSLTKAAHVVVSGATRRKSGYAAGEQTESVVPHLRRSTACLWTQPFRAGLIFGAGPLGLDCKHRFPMFIPPLTCPRQVSCSRHAHGRPGQAG